MRIAALLLLAAAALAQDPADFEERLGETRKLVESGSWGTARRKLDRLLEDHAYERYVLARATDVADLMRQCVFRQQYGLPDPKSLVKGRLISYNRVTGRIRILYESAGNDDFTVEQRLIFHKVRFKGPHSLTLQGNPVGSYLVCLDEGAVYHIFPGGGRMPGFIAEIAGKKITRLDEAERPAGKDIRIKVNRRSIQVYAGTRKYLEAKKPKDRWGHLGATGAGFGVPIVLEGQAEPAWIQSMADREDQKRRAEFDKKYDEKEHLPGWLFERAERSTALAKPDGRTFPVAAYHELATMLTGKIEAGHAELALKVIDASGVPAILRSHLRAAALEQLGRTRAALEECRKVCVADPEFVPALEQCALLERRLGNPAEAARIYLDLLRRYPGGTDLCARAVIFLVDAGHPAEARKALADALARGLRSADLDVANRTVVKMLNGPPWGKRYEFESKHYQVISNIDRTTSEKAARMLERAYKEYVRTLDAVSDAESRRFRVYLFRGRAGFRGYCKEIYGDAGSPHTAGLYSHTFNQLFIWNLPQREMMYETILHEGFHQYLDRVMEDVPLWFNEGMAEYYGARGEFREEHVRRLRETGLVPLEKFLRLDRAAFMGSALHHYAQAWAFITWVRAEEPELFQRFWDCFKRYPTAQTALQHALAGLDLVRLHRRFESWFQKQ